MSQNKYIAAIEICSSKIIGAVGVYSESGKLDVLAVEQEHAIECVCHGLIHNVEETATHISRIIERLEKRAGVTPRKIKSVYVGLSGRSLRNVPKDIFRELPEDTEITHDILTSMNNEAAESHIDSSLEVIDVVPASYYVNKTKTKSPAGTFGNNIRVHYQLIAARPLLRKHLMRVVRDKVGMTVADTVVTPTAVGNLILSDDERRLGCMLVDMGAETTTVVIYQNGSLHYLAVLPMGSRNITLDITSLSVLEKEAEEVKTNSGNAIPSGNLSSLNINGMRLSDVSNIVVARAEEIVANIIEQINYAGITPKQLSGGIITVGGGFNLNRMGELLHRQSALNVRRGSLPSNITLEDTKAPTYETIEVISIMNAGTAANAPECLEMPTQEEMPRTDYEPDEESLKEKDTPQIEQPQRNGILGSLAIKAKGILAGMFNANDDDDSDFK